MNPLILQRIKDESFIGKYDLAHEQIVALVMYAVRQEEHNQRLKAFHEEEEYELRDIITDRDDEIEELERKRDELGEELEGVREQLNDTLDRVDCLEITLAEVLDGQE